MKTDRSPIAGQIVKSDDFRAILERSKGYFGPKLVPFAFILTILLQENGSVKSIPIYLDRNTESKSPHHRPY